MKTLGIWVLGILLAIVILVVLAGISFGWRYVSEPVRVEKPDDAKSTRAPPLTSHKLI